MITFKYPFDLSKLSPTDPAYLIVAYDTPDPEVYGYIVLTEEGDAERVLSEIWDDWTLRDIPRKGITRRDDLFLAIILANNEFRMAFVIPDASWV